MVIGLEVKLGTWLYNIVQLVARYISVHSLVLYSFAFKAQLFHITGENLSLGTTVKNQKLVRNGAQTVTRTIIGWYTLQMSQLANQ